MKQRVLLVAIIFSVICVICGCYRQEDSKRQAPEETKENSETEEHEEGTILHGDHAEISLYTSGYAKHITIPMIATGELSSVGVREEDLSIGDAVIDETLCLLSEEYEGFAYYFIILRFKTWSTVGAEITSIPLVVNGQPVDYQFGVMRAVEPEVPFTTQDELGFTAVTFEDAISAIEMVCFKLLAEEKVTLVDVLTSSQLLCLSEEDIHKACRTYRKNNEFEVIIYTVEPVEKFYCFDTVVAYTTDSDEIKYIVGYCHTSSNFTHYFKYYVDSL